ncbi:hypothetical protein [Caenispirillum salinarum]|uniref:hypothetical protein n=1 Tax=Caenispirillum salinarum TaxID=859058 RepID=UPI00384B7038
MLGVVIAVNARRRVALVEVNGGGCSLMTDCREIPAAGSVLEGLLDRKGIETLRNINANTVFEARIEVTGLPKKAALVQLLGGREGQRASA